MLKHTLTIGLFDKDEHAQVIAKNDAVNLILTAICKRDFCATVSTEGVYGVYRHTDGTVVVEPSIRVEIAGVERAAILPLIHELRVALNQECIMFESVETPIDFVDVNYK